MRSGFREEGVRGFTFQVCACAEGTSFPRHDADTQGGFSVEPCEELVELDIAGAVDAVEGLGSG
jgi:hypothetical protein